MPSYCYFDGNISDLHLEIKVAKVGEYIKATNNRTISCISDCGATVINMCKTIFQTNFCSKPRLQNNIGRLQCKDYFEKQNPKKRQLLGKLYVLKLKLLFKCANVSNLMSMLMHRRMGHSSKYKTNLCETCLKGKQTKLLL